jgi:hypothetical protein
VTTRLVVPHVTVTVDGASGPVYPSYGSVQLDSTRVPYAYATVVLPLTPDTMLEALDPREDHRVIINAGNTGNWEPVLTGYGHGPYGHGPYGNS